MADPQNPPAPRAPSPWTPELIRYLGTIAVLAILVAILAITGQRDGLNTVLGGLVGFATSGHPGNSADRSTVAGVTMGLAFAAGAIGHALGA